MSEKWFKWYIEQVGKDKKWPEYKGRFLCPCCYMPTLEKRVSWNICTLCFWEDDGQDSDDADVVRCGPNRDYSLAEARSNFSNYQTMYRPSDKDDFEREKRQFDFKHALLKAYQKAITTDSQVDLSNAIAMHEKYYEDDEC